MEDNSLDFQRTSFARHILRQLWRNVGGFFYDWFAGVPLSYGRGVMRGFRDWDKSWGFVATAKNWLKPMWQDYSLPGYVIGFVLRTLRIILAFLFYIVYFTLATVGIFLWYAAPIGIAYYIAVNLFG